MKGLSALLSIILGSQICLASVTQLNPSNVDSLTAGKTVFVKFFAPWCGHCKSMAADFEKLAADWEGHAVGLIAEIDCTDEVNGGQELCEEYKVEGFPTIMYGDPAAPETYEGGRDYESMAAFCKEKLSTPTCGINNLDACDDEQKAVIETFLMKSKSELESISTEVADKLAKAQTEYEAEIEKLQESYESMTKTFNENNEIIRKESKIALVKQVLAKLKTSDDKGDEL